MIFFKQHAIVVLSDYCIAPSCRMCRVLQGYEIVPYVY